MANVEVFVQQPSGGRKGSRVTRLRHLISWSQQCKHGGSFSRALLNQVSGGGPTGPLSVCYHRWKEGFCLLIDNYVFRETLRVWLICTSSAGPTPIINHREHIPLWTHILFPPVERVKAVLAHFEETIPIAVGKERPKWTSFSPIYFLFFILTHQRPTITGVQTWKNIEKLLGEIKNTRLGIMFFYHFEKK